MLETGTDAFTSVYRYDYVPIDRGCPFRPKKDNQRTHTVNETESFINISDESPLPLPAPVDLAIEYLENTFKNEQPKLYKKYFKEPLRKEEVQVELLKDTVYVHDYCRHMKGPVEDKFNIVVDSPEAIESTMRDHFRQPSKFGKLTHTIAKGIPSALSKNQRVVAEVASFDINSEYTRTIGSAGKFIMDNEMYGKMVYPS